ncbi:double-headed protease inhibitor, submandibular gland-like [Sarcophilus harrisii]|uniref:Kazal-like domain-containing protein n=1 Tax=Sarcophilus harrisii TaxID=9305 RepID=A0A7N4NWD7_SARHA|nr:double-headed protease inhibitor, submandibular gland [Sarcophilus harrisii]XP_031809570.1 double-headed protease inhibitor, submandibular gland-like [Sarcophilus harrisii]
MMKSAILAFLALATSTWAFSDDNQAKVSQVKGTKINCSKYSMVQDNGLLCPRFFDPLCGSDGNDYSNECMLCASNLEKKQNIRKLHDGKCVQCPKEEQPLCTLELRLHCASDGIAYSNKCTFCNAVVKSRNRLTLKNYGAC